MCYYLYTVLLTLHRHPGHHNRDTVTISHIKNRERYHKMVTDAPRGLVTLVLMVDNCGNEVRTRRLKEAFCTAVYNWQRSTVQLCYLCHHSNPWWLPGLVEHCISASSERILKLGDEVTAGWVEACHSGKVVTVLAVFGARRQFSVFPEQFESSGGGQTAACETKGETTPPRSSVGGACGETTPSRSSVGEVLGSTLGLDTEDDSPDSSERLTGMPSDNRSIHTDEDKDVSVFKENFTLWLGRLADGSLKRYQVDTWPEWGD